MKNKRDTYEKALADLEENYRQQTEEGTKKAAEIQQERATFNTYKEEHLKLKNRLREVIYIYSAIIGFDFY